MKLCGGEESRARTICLLLVGEQERHKQRNHFPSSVEIRFSNTISSISLSCQIVSQPFLPCAVALTCFSLDCHRIFHWVYI